MLNYYIDVIIVGFAPGESKVHHHCLQTSGDNQLKFYYKNA
jgi:hypothetical protein